MSKRKALHARDLRPGDVVRLVYEIEVDEIGDLDTKFPTESADMFFIKGTVKRGPMRKRTGEFAIYGDDKLSVICRKKFWQKVRERLGNLIGAHPDTSNKNASSSDASPDSKATHSAKREVS